VLNWLIFFINLYVQDIFNTLKKLAECHDDVAVRVLALTAIADHHKNDASTLHWVKSLVQCNNNIKVRMAALSEFAHGWRDDPGLMKLLRELAWGDRDREFRDFCDQKLAELKAKSQTSNIKTSQYCDCWLAQQAGVKELVRKS
jgi:hypothetical protein